MKRFENPQQLESISVQHLDPAALVIDQTATSDLGSAQFSGSVHSLSQASWRVQGSHSTEPLKRDTGASELNNNSEPDNIIHLHDQSTEVVLRFLLHHQDFNACLGHPKRAHTQILHTARKSGGQGQGELEGREKEVEQHFWVRRSKIEQYWEAGYEVKAGTTGVGMEREW